MLNKTSCLALLMAAVLPSSVTAQTASTNAGDIAYCKALASRFQSQAPLLQAPTAGVTVAVLHCDDDPADSIKTFEAKLRGDGVTLPSREQAGRQR